MLRPFLLRRLKSDVEKGLPPKKETILKMGMSEMQKKYYAALLQKDIEAITAGALSLPCRPCVVQDSVHPSMNRLYPGSAVPEFQSSELQIDYGVASSITTHEYLMKSMRLHGVSPVVGLQTMMTARKVLRQL